MEIKPFDLFHKEWALLTAGPFDKYNSMTISWGELGTLWNKSVATVYVKPCRYTYNFMEENDYFVLSFFQEEYRDALSIMGNKDIHVDGDIIISNLYEDRLLKPYGFVVSKE